jgi:hypothetical protein
MGQFEIKLTHRRKVESLDNCVTSYRASFANLERKFVSRKWGPRGRKKGQ